MGGDGGGVVVGDRKPAFDILEVADERGVEDERLRADFVAGHALGEAGDFGSGESGVPDADFGHVTSKKSACSG